MCDASIIGKAIPSDPFRFWNSKPTHGTSRALGFVPTRFSFHGGVVADAMNGTCRMSNSSTCMFETCTHNDRISIIVLLVRKQRIRARTIRSFVDDLMAFVSCSALENVVLRCKHHEDETLMHFRASLATKRIGNEARTTKEKGTRWILLRTFPSFYPRKRQRDARRNHAKSSGSKSLRSHSVPTKLRWFRRRKNALETISSCSVSFEAFSCFARADTSDVSLRRRWKRFWKRVRAT